MSEDVEFKIHFPTGFKVEDPLDDFLDVNVVVLGTVYYVTLYTVKNVQKFFEMHPGSYFWCADMIIVKDLYIETIRSVINNIIVEGYLNEACSCIGLYEDIFSEKDERNGFF